jgi:hypothetical protein
MGFFSKKEPPKPEVPKGPDLSGYTNRIQLLAARFVRVINTDDVPKPMSQANTDFAIKMEEEFIRKLLVTHGNWDAAQLAYLKERHVSEEALKNGTRGRK